MGGTSSAVGHRRFIVGLMAVVPMIVGLPATSAAAATPTRHEGALADGATWVVDVPNNWNGTLLLYSHGYTPGPANPARNSPNPATGDALLARGYALAGSSYSHAGWALETAAQDQLDTLRVVQSRIGQAEH